jgi:hypothetical protein
VSLANSTVLDASNYGNGDSFNPLRGNGGTILINGGALFTSQQSTVLATSASGLGGTIRLNAKTIILSDTHVTTSVFVPDFTCCGPPASGGTITIDAKNLTLTKSQILSTATEGPGGTIAITAKTLRQDASSGVDASSQFGTNGTVTINGVVQP